MAHKHQDGNRSTTGDVEVLWSALSITMSEYGHFLNTSYLGPQTTTRTLTTHVGDTCETCGKALGDHDLDLKDQICGHIPPQAPHWASTRHHYNTGWSLAHVYSHIYRRPQTTFWSNGTRVSWRFRRDARIVPLRACSGTSQILFPKCFRLNTP